MIKFLETSYPEEILTHLCMLSTRRVLVSKVIRNPSLCFLSLINDVFQILITNIHDLFTVFQIFLRYLFASFQILRRSFYNLSQD